MFRFILSVYRYIRGFFPSEITPGIVERPKEDGGVASSAVPGKKKVVDTWVDGDYSSAGALLDDLEDRYQFLKKFKPRISAGGQRLIKKVGVYMVDIREDRSRVHVNKLDGGGGRRYPQVFAVAMQDKSSGDRIAGESQLIVAEKIKYEAKRHGGILVRKPHRGWFYSLELVIYWDDSFSTHSVPIEISKNGIPEIMTTREMELVMLPRGQNHSHYHRLKIDKPDLGVSCDDEAEGVYSKELAIKRTLETFTIAYNYNLRRDASTCVYASRGKTVMVFSVPVHKWKNFFKDRITVVAADGKRKRIFHHVAAHKRKNGSVVKMHTRGETRFKWGEFSIKIAEWKRGRMMYGDFDLIDLRQLSYAEACKAKDEGVRVLDSDGLGDFMHSELTKDIHRAVGAVK